MNTAQLAEIVQDYSTPLVRTDFSDDDAWQRVRDVVATPVYLWGCEAKDDDGYVPNLTPVSDRGYEGVTGAGLAAEWTSEATGHLLLADKRTIAESADLTVVFVDLAAEPGRTFRCSIDEMASIEANLFVANMGFEEFADKVGPDGVFRGFQR